MQPVCQVSQSGFFMFRTLPHCTEMKRFGDLSLRFNNFTCKFKVNGGYNLHSFSELSVPMWIECMQCSPCKRVIT